jgi:hypothetical protein
LPSSTILALGRQAGVALALSWMAGLCAAQNAPQAASANKNVAPGFAGPSSADRIVLMPVDVELFSLSAGGVVEPKADWTAAAQTHMKAAIAAKKAELKLPSQELSDSEADEFAEQVGLHAAVARSIALHHSLGGMWALPTKAGALDWSFDDAMQPLRQKSGARYALFVWVRDTYASAERKAAMVALALLGVGISGGVQVGYASLVDLDSGRVVWFNRLVRAQGDLREAAPAKESIDALLSGFPAPR